MGETLTALEQRVLAAVRAYHARHGRMPTIREIGAMLGIRSPGTVGRYVDALVDKGHLSKRQPRVWRGLSLADPSGRPGLPLVGRIAAGRPIEAIAGQTEIDLNELFGGPDRYALKVAGDSMIDAGIHDGDLVVVRRQETADDGQIIVALIGNEVTLKFLHRRRDGRIELRPANGGLEPLVCEADQLLIQGVVVGQLRTYR